MSTRGEPRFVFLHIQKTAGTTFARILNRQFPKSARVYLHGLSPERVAPRLERLSEARRLSARLVVGHFTYGMHEQFPGPSRYLTLLREPIDRFVSACYFDLGNRGGSLAEHRAPERSEALIAAYLDETIRRGKNSLQTRVIAGPACPGEPEDALERAKLHLERDFDLVGLTERFDQTMLLCRRRFGWNNIIYERTRVTRGRPGVESLPAPLREAITAANARDVELYRWAAERFAGAVEAARIPAWELSAYRALNRYYSLAKRTLRPWFAD